MTLHLLRLDPDARASARWFAAENLLPREDEDGSYRWHALLTAAFGAQLAPKPFRVLVRRGRPIQLLAYSTADPAALDAALRDFADPVVLEALGLAKRPLAAKAMPRFAAGRRLGFSLHVRPSVRTDRAGDRAKTAEIDAFVAALRAAEAGGLPRPDREAVYAKWIRARLAAGGARVCLRPNGEPDMRFDGLARAPAVRRDAGRRLVRVEGHAATVAGVLEVADADAFAALLARGVGRHRAFGYGMLLLSPP